jgi:hypothetical protein
MQHIRTLNLLFSGTPQFRFNRHQNKVFLDINWESDVSVGEYVVIECYRKMDPDTITLSGTLTGIISSNTVVGTNTIFDQQIVENDFITLSDGQNVQVKRINSPTEILLSKPLTANVTSVTATLQGISDVWDDRFLKKYATALIKRQWGENMKKFGGIQMPGGVTLNGKEIFDEALEEITRLEEDLQQYNVLPSDFIMG